jgi:ketosteroid isomerase-like protein
LTEDEIRSLLREIQGAFDRRDLEIVVSYYHPDITYIGPAFPKPIMGIDSLTAAFNSNFQTPQRTSTIYKEIQIQYLSEKIFVIQCKVEGTQTIYFSQRRFTGWLSRVFIETEHKPLIIHEHFSIIE